MGAFSICDAAYCISWSTDEDHCGIYKPKKLVLDKNNELKHSQNLNHLENNIKLKKNSDIPLNDTKSDYDATSCSYQIMYILPRLEPLALCSLQGL